LTLESMIYLGIDTSTTYLALSLWSPEHGLLSSSQEHLGREHAKRFISSLDTLLQTARIKKSDLSGIGVGIGPGSYTGLRVGIAGAKGLARALGITLSGVDSLAAVAYGCLQNSEKGLITFDARRGHVYAGLYQRQGMELLTLENPKKLELTYLQQHYSGFNMVQDQCPDATYIAMQAWQNPQKEAIALYL
jgi:tRNA threonylcarbamoyladenosine biosynthesis protein TsaB